MNTDPAKLLTPSTQPMAKLIASAGVGALLLLLGVVLGGGWLRSPDLLGPLESLRAVATDRQETFAMATAAVEEGVEAIFTLDSLSGDLKGAILNPGSRTFTVTYQRNIMADLGVEVGKTPKFLLVTGQSYLRTGSNFRLAPCTIYVAEITSGKLAAYTFAFSHNSISRPEIVPTQEFVLLQVVPIRSNALRE